VVTRYN
jgi:aubergine-like protein